MTTDRTMAMKMATDRYAEFLASAGIPHAQLALQVLYYLPPDFLSAYEDLWRTALGGDDGGSGAKGEAGARTAELGRSKGGGKQLKGGGGKRRFKKYFTVRNEDALELKGRVDKRLRALARDFKADLELLDATIGASREVAQMRADRMAEHREAMAEVAKRKMGVSCEVCGRFCSINWRFCAHCGATLGE